MRSMHDHPLVLELSLSVVLERAAASFVIDPALVRQLDALDDAELLRSLAALDHRPGSDDPRQ